VFGGYQSLSLEKIDGVVAVLEPLADFGKWDHTSDNPDLPAEYPETPALSHACMALGCGLESPAVSCGMSGSTS
jgi:hypothetical protein